MMDDENYAEHFSYKMRVYSQNGYIAGKNLLLTYETQNAPLRLEEVKQIISHFLL